MYKKLRLIFLFCAIFWSNFSVDGQSTISIGMQNYLKGNYSKAIEEFNNSLVFFKNQETPQLDSISYIYEHLQFCYSNRMKLDSTIIVLKEAESYFLNNRIYNKYTDFKLAKGEMVHMFGSIDEARLIFEELVEFEYSTAHVKMRAYLRLANQYMGIPDKEKSYSSINESLKLALQEKDSSFLGNIYDGYGSIESFFGSKQKAIDYFIKAIPFVKKDNKTFVLSTLYRKIGFLFYGMSDQIKAKEYVYRGLEIAEEHKIKREKAFCSDIIGSILIDEGKYEEADEVLAFALTYFTRRRLHNQLLEVKSKLAIANLKLGKIEKAKGFMESAQINLGKANSYGFILKFHFRGIAFYTEFREKERAIHHLNKAEEIIKSSENKAEELSYLKIKSNFERTFGNFEKALDDIDDYISLKDSLNFLTQAEITLELESKFKKNEQDKEIALLNSENELKASRLSSQRIKVYGGVIASLVFGWLSVFVFRLYKKVQSQNRVIKIALNEKDTLLREIHHRVKNNLQVISSYVIDEGALSALRQGQDRVQSMALIHQELYENNDLSGVNTYIYLEQLMENLIDSYNIDEDKISYNIEVDEIILDVDTMIPLGLIINELVSNALKHAFVETAKGEINVKLNERNGKLHLQVSDDGIGVKSLKDIEGKSFGFELIKAFAKKLKAKMNVSYKKGLSIEIVVSEYKKAS